jgi:hemerythrin-like domain-containing protein
MEWGREAYMLRQSLSHNLDGLSALCIGLEQVADSLPDRFDPQHCLHLTRVIRSMVKDAHVFEEEILFPTLADQRPDDPSLRAMFERLHWEHVEDESYGEEIIEALNELVTGKLRNIDSLSYMLRGFFEGLRRHIAFERDHILPLLSEA